jgi:hypothetical protein
MEGTSVGMFQNWLQGGAQQEFQDFVNRYEQGPPHEGYSGEEALSRYQQVASQLPADQYQQAAEEAFQRMDPQQLQQFAEYVQQQSQTQGVQMPSVQPQQYQNPSALAEMLTGMHQQQPGMLGQLLGGGTGGGGMLQSPAAKAVLAGIAAMAVKRMMTGH